MRLSSPFLRPQFPHPLSLWFIVVTVLLLIFPSRAPGQQGTGDGPNLGEDRITQEQITNGTLSFNEILNFGLKIFSTPFNKYDGYGDDRPTLQDNTTFLRVNGLDAQSCLECHSIVSSATIPATFGVGGVGGSNSNVIFRPTKIKLKDGDMNGRFINPPFLFGSGAVELIAKEMTIRLQELKAQGFASPGEKVALVAKGVSFGTIIVDERGNLDTSNIEGIDQDLVVRPFGRKGEFATVRAFDRGAMQFHFGMQPVEVVGEGEDPDGDGVTDEVLIGELSALHIFGTTLPKPEMVALSEDLSRGFIVFDQIGCSDCHKPFLYTNTKVLTYSYPEIEEDPTANTFRRVDLTKAANFRPNEDGGIEVPLFADLKRHNMGSGLAESFEEVVPRTEFTTARLWGVADTAPYLHDGRALTIKEAILMHGGEAETSRNAFDALEDDEMQAVLSLLYSLRTPTKTIQAR
ncbi:MAG: di-heme oxidoredictase family protein [Deltaproteobacteria bacterium]